MKMPSKFQTTVEMVAHTAKDITSHPETFMSFLETAANNYKYSFRDQMLIFAQKPSATACAEIEVWNKLGRYVNRGTKGIALLVDRNVPYKLRHVFDISDTNSYYGNEVRLRSQAPHTPASLPKALLRLLKETLVGPDHTDYFVMQLCGLKRPLIHVSDAASFGLYDLQNKRFDYEVNADIVTDHYIAGIYRNIPVSIAVGDNQASVFSTLADEENVLLNIGTGSQISIISDRIIKGENIETRPYFENKFLVVGAALCGGRAYSALKDFYAQILGYVTEVTEEQVYAIMSSALSSIENTSLKVDTRFAGTRNNAHITGSITGITTEIFTPAEITLGVLDSMVSELYGMYRQMQTLKSGVVGSDNGIRKNAHLVKVVETRFGTAMIIPAHMEEAAVGAAFFAAISCKIFRNAQEAQHLIRYV